MSCLACLIGWLLTILIPAYLTYDSVMKKPEHLKTWAVYWLFYNLIKSIQWMIPFLDNALLNMVFLLFFVWLYNEDFKGAMVIIELVKSTFASNDALRDGINMIGEKLAFLNLFEQKPPIQKSKMD